MYLSKTKKSWLPTAFASSETAVGTRFKKKNFTAPLFVGLASIHAAMSMAYAQEPASETSMATVYVIGSDENLINLGGAGQILGKKELECFHQLPV